MEDEIIIEEGSPNGEPSDLSNDDNSNKDDEMTNKINSIIKEQMSAFKTEFESIKELSKTLGEENKNLKMDLHKREINQLLIDDPNLDSGFYDFIYSDDIEEVKQKISILSGMINDRVKTIADNQVNERLNGGYKPPKGSSLDDDIKRTFERPRYMV